MGMHRVELNAFTSPDLIKFLERKLAESGANDKLIPPTKILKKHSGEVFAKKFRMWTEEEVWSALGLENIVEALQERFSQRVLRNITPKQVSEILKLRREIAWRGAIEGEIKKTIENDRKDMLSALVEELQMAVETFLGERE